MVYDLGGGTFDVTVMEIRDTIVRALATDGNVRLGGWDWDQRLVDLVAEGFIRQNRVEPAGRPRAAGKLWRECEEAKRTLSARNKATIPCDYRGFSAQIKVTRKQFEGPRRTSWTARRFTATQTLQSGRAGVEPDRSRAAGGRIDADAHGPRHVAAGLRQGAGRVGLGRRSGGPRRGVHAGLVLAKAQGRPPTFKIENVNSHSLGVVGTDPLTKRKRNGMLIPRNTPLPVTAKRTFRTQKAGQTLDPGAGGGRRKRLARRLLAIGPLHRPPSAAGAWPCRRRSTCSSITSPTGS